MIKKGGLKFLNRRNQSLFDTNVEIRDLDNVELAYNSAAIPDSGTAKVRARPTVKHFSTFGDGGMGFAVPTPKVPILPPSNRTQISNTGAGSTDRLSQISIDDVNDGQFLIPPPPSVAPPPPPPQFIPPSPGHDAASAFFGDSGTVDLATLQPPSIPPPKPPSKAAPQDFTMSALKPAPVASPKPPSATVSAIQTIPDCPKFTPPLPPTVNSRSPKIRNNPPTKPIRYSSIPNFELLQFDPTTPNHSFSTTPSHSLNPPNNVSPSMSPVPPIKPMRRYSSGLKLENDLQELNQNLKENQSTVSKPEFKSTPSHIEKRNIIEVPLSGSSKHEGIPGISAKEILQPAPVQSYSPLLNKKLRNLRTHEASNIKEPAASPLALLMAAKQREKQKSVSRQNSTKSTGSLDYHSTGTIGSIHPSETSPNTFTVDPNTPKSTVINYHNPSPSMDPKPNSPKHISYRSKTLTDPGSSIMGNIPTKQISLSPPPGKYSEIDGSFIPPPPEFANSDPENETPPVTPSPYIFAKNAGLNQSQNSNPIANSFVGPSSSNSLETTMTSSASTIQESQASFTYPPKIQPQTLPPSPPKALPPSPPKALPPSPPKTLPPSPPNTLPPFPPKTLPPSPPKYLPQAPPLTLPNTVPFTPLRTPAKTQPQVPSSNVAPTSVVESQATLLSILQKKMLQMDAKISQSPEEHSEWDEEDEGFSQLNSTPKPKSLAMPVQTARLDMNELENKVAKKAQSKPTTSAKQQFGMTFVVRPGTKQPITPVAKSE